VGGREVRGTVVLGPTGCGEVESFGCLVAWKFTVTRSTVLVKAEVRSRQARCRCISDSHLEYCSKIPPAKIRVLYYTVSFQCTESLNMPGCLYAT
jgi:hypothetical protein